MSRPEGWKYGNWQKDSMLLRGPPTDVNERLYNAFEAGADAMLEGLKSKPDTIRLKTDGTSKIPASHGFPEIIIEGKPIDKGWLIHIPEEKEK